MDSRRHPIKNLTAQLQKHQAFSRRNFSRIAAFYIKLFLQEPFRIVEQVSCNSEIRDHKLSKDPIFIVGHWRSGTSFLQYLLGQDPQFGFLNKFQVVFPDIFLQSEHFLKPFIQQLPETLNIIRDAQNMSINLELDSPSEVEIALTTMISPSSLHWGHIFPQQAWEYFDKYLFLDSATGKEVQRWKKDYHYLIKKASIKNEGRQLLIKSPGNAARMEQLLEQYPNAKFIFIHRNPYDVFYSSKKLWRTLLDNLALQEFTEEQMEEIIIQVYKKLMSRYLEQKKGIPSEQLAEIRFEHFVTNPIDQLQDVYKSLEIDGFSNAKNSMQQFLEQKEGKSSDYKYENRIISLINTHWRIAFEKWDYQIIEASEYA